MYAAPAVLGPIVDFVVREPVLTGLMVFIFFAVIAVYLYLRRTVLNMRAGYDDAYRGK